MSAVSSQQKASKMKVILDMRRIRQTLQPLRPLFAIRNLYREHYNMLKTQWACCPLQRSYLFDRRDVYHTVTGTYDCYDYIRYNHSQIIQCERAIRRELSKNSREYATYDTLSNGILKVYIQNLKKYYDCNDPQLWKSQENEQEQLINYQYE